MRRFKPIRGRMLSRLRKWPVTTASEVSSTSARPKRSRPVWKLVAGPNGVIRKPKFEAVDLGMRIQVTPKVSADQRFVQIDLKYETANLAGSGSGHARQCRRRSPAGPHRPAVPDDWHGREPVCDSRGGTVLIAGPKMIRDEVTLTANPHLMSRIPYLNRLFAVRSSTPTTVRQLLVVTPRLMAAEPEVHPPMHCSATAAAKVIAAAPCQECRAADPKVVELVAAYRKACLEGRTEAAATLAIRVLALDPTCFVGPVTQPILK